MLTSKSIMNKPKVYISGAITGVEDFMTHFSQAESKLIEDGFSVVNPAKVNGMLPQDTDYEEYMKMSMCMLDMCDYICMLKGWQDSRGANREYVYALAKDKTIIFE